MAYKLQLPAPTSINMGSAGEGPVGHSLEKMGSIGPAVTELTKYFSSETAESLSGLSLETGEEGTRQLELHDLAGLRPRSPGQPQRRSCTC